MKKKFSNFLGATAAIFAALAGLDVSGIVTVMPPQTAKLLTVIPAAAAAGLYLAKALKKTVDE